MFRFIARRLLEAVPVLFIIVAISFVMLHQAPGGPFDSEKAVTPEVLRNLEAHYGPNNPLHVQFFDYLKSVLLHFDFGPSFKYPNRTVNEIIADKLPVSLELGLTSLTVALLIGIPLGTLAAIYRNKWADYLCSTIKLLRPQPHVLFS